MRSTNYGATHGPSLIWAGTHGQSIGCCRVETILASRRTREDSGILNIPVRVAMHYSIVHTFSARLNCWDGLAGRHVDAIDLHCLVASGTLYCQKGSNPSKSGNDRRTIVSFEPHQQPSSCLRTSISSFLVSCYCKPHACASILYSSASVTLSLAQSLGRSTQTPFH
jgi:hypothetical protein